MDPVLVDRARAWIAGDPDPATREELQRLVDAGDEDAVRVRVDGQLAFGTAGLRGEVGAGPLRMNRAVVIRTTRGLADHLLDTVPDAAARGVVVGYDARHDSADFARDVAGVLAAAGIRVHAFDEPRPTPLVAYAQRVLDAAAAVVVTASHNPPADNGYKVYAEGASQIVPPTDAAIAAAIDEVGAAVEVPRVEPDGHRLVGHLDDRLVERYLADLRAARPRVTGPDLTIVYTPLHGVGGALVVRALADAGHTDVHVVASQAEPDGDFPTVAFPNPEEPGAMDAAAALAIEVGAELVLANDPDADRLAVGVPGPDGVRLLTGNQIGVLLADHLLRHAKVARPLVLASIVSTPMLRSIAEEHGAHAEYTLTGFKWICAAARVLEERDGYTTVYGFEEALGSMVGTVVRDKDGIGAAVVFADLARALAESGEGIAGRLRALAERHGLWVSHQLSITRPGLEGQADIARAMDLLRDDRPSVLAGHEVTHTADFRVGVEQRPAWLGAHDLVSFDLADGRAMIRPSGTEPKCKIYVDLRGTLGRGDDLDARSAALEAEAAAVAADLAHFVGLD